MVQLIEEHLALRWFFIDKSDASQIIAHGGSNCAIPGRHCIILLTGNVDLHLEYGTM